MSYVLYFRCKPDGTGYENTCYMPKEPAPAARYLRGCLLEHIIGETLAHLFTLPDTPLELLRLHRYGLGETIIVFKRPTDIKVTIFEKGDKRPIRRNTDL